MKLWLISQTKFKGYDTYDSAVVAAENEEEASKTEVGSCPLRPTCEGQEGRDYCAWANPEDVVVEYLGEAKEGTPAGVICASFNAG